MTDGRVLSQQRIRQREKDAILWLECNPDDLKTKRELDLYATIRDLQRQVSELTEERDQLKRDNKDLNKRVHQMNGAGSYLAISTADLEQALRDVRFTVNDDSRPLENRMVRVDYIVKQALYKHAPRQEDAK